MHVTACVTTTVAAAAAAAQTTSSLRDIKHIILFMQENRAFDHVCEPAQYFGTMAGVRGFADANLQINPDGLSVFQQPIANEENGVDLLLPWHATYLGGKWDSGCQCMSAGSNGWRAQHSWYNRGLGNNWTIADTVWSMAYFDRSDLPTHFDIVDGWTVLDMNHQSVLGPTSPNRAWWWSGSINVPGGPTNPSGNGGIVIDDTITPGCETPLVNCFPFYWKTVPEFLQEAGISWKVWQDVDNFEDNELPYFEQYQKAPDDSPLHINGDSYPGMQEFYDRAANGTLPQVNYVVGPQELSEHAPNRPIDGAWYQKKVIDSITKGSAYNSTVLIVSYDEEGGWADHVVPKVAPQGTPGEWLEDPYGEFGYIPVGPGARIPRYVISPWTRGNNVYTANADHSSDILFVEQWAAANGYDLHVSSLTQWRRDHMSNLVDVLDFENPDYSLPDILQPPTPERKPDPGITPGLLGSFNGPWVGPSQCLAEFPDPRPPVPFGPDNVNQKLPSLVEEGFKNVRGKLTEGRYLTFEMFGLALTNLDGVSVGVDIASAAHDIKNQRWIVHETNDSGEEFYIQSDADKKYIAAYPVLGSLTDDKNQAQAFKFTYVAAGATYSISMSGDEPHFVTLKSAAGQSNPGVEWSVSFGLSGFKIYSVHYNN